ncbi:hypothetical protein O9993_12365 [Vibrio lentus]|nr:hypothetical protein [Vibrio lentus]
MGIVVTCIQHSYNDDVDYYVEVEEIKAIEAARRAQLEKNKETVSERRQLWSW